MEEERLRREEGRIREERVEKREWRMEEKRVKNWRRNKRRK